MQPCKTISPVSSIRYSDMYISMKYLHGVVDGVFGVIRAEFFFVEDTGSSIKLQLELSSQGALEVYGPKRFGLADGDTFDLNRDR